MVKERLDIQDQPEVLSIFEHIDNGHNFLLSGGAGSGKTYSLVSVIRQVIKENPTIKIACMTYTNSAVKEIEDRVNHKNLKVSTIHDFLWDNIKNFQSELKSTLIQLAKDDTVTNIVIDDPEETLSENIEIQYKEYVRLREGIISHDEVLTISEYMFVKYHKLCDILKDKFRFIFIDEYQDTNEQVIRIFLNHLRISKKESIIGLFGDAMQSIYDDGIGTINSYLEEGIVKEVVKSQNRRNPKKIYELANKLRTDGITQEHSSDLSAPNILPDGNVKDGNILFLHSVNKDIEKIKKYLENLSQGWNFDNSKTTKELNLTHNLISAQAGFSTLMEIYDEDPVINLKKDLVEKIKSDNLNIEDEKTFNEIVDELGLQSRLYLLDEINLDMSAKEEFEEIKSLPKENFSDLEFESELLIELKEKTLKQKKIPKKNLNKYNTIDELVSELNFTTNVLKKNKMLSNETHRLLYEKVKDKSFNEIRKIYIDKENLIDDKREVDEQNAKKGSKRDNFIKHLFKIQNVLRFYSDKNFPEFFRIMKKNGISINTIEDKRKLKNNIEQLLTNQDTTIGQVIDKADELRIVKKDDKLDEFISSSEYLYAQVKEVSYQEFIKLYNYLEGLTPFSTQHKTKGTEFDNVLVILDSGNWTKYNFNYLFTNRIDKASVLERTQKLFYVCCTRSKENLAVFFQDPSFQVLETAKNWFDIVINLDESTD
ncbi:MULTISPECIES: UvrD-helicase domain-containing protein [Chryseobacterium]|uniref:UvrD-helicase domain-containing protein n=1 Tax=Chryseobacterium TaxID=59732 RepID=UPI00195BBA9B|nr:MULTISPECIES: UvrD-helicase domain-containing protein [Chryseobacterium]MBM7421171.1 superfamily I DNA/RNA helicase [Chryseobacterium sp. JUb44]MDH6211131.1 DNA helicase-2/ATP-dependent DNA helicase PcrA [Chryseobacterium sp. BIGb0186]WSO09794.1 UvrD-helicase domain-containing protein [Chryseobacterium scophthalmum]